MSEKKERKLLSILIKGKGILHPCETGVLSERVACIREYGVNVFFYTKGNQTIMIDAGYLEYPLLNKKLEKIGIDSHNIRDIFLTHTDPDHTGAIDQRSEGLFVNAKVYLSNLENEYVEGTATRKLLHLKPVRRPLIPNKVITLEDKQCIMIENIKVQCFVVAGHTKGHMCYLIDDEYLFTGDCIALNGDGGYPFIWFLCVNNRLNMKSLTSFRQDIMTYNIKEIYTAHTGMTYGMDHFFAHSQEQWPVLFRKKPFDSNAPYDLYATEEK